MNRSTLSITHSHAEGTILHGTARGDGAAEVAKTHQLRWSRPLEAWYVPHSRDKLAGQKAIQELAAALTEVGFSVDITIDDEPRDQPTIEEDTRDRLNARAEILAQRATRIASKAAAADLRQQQASDRLPPGGEPIKIGHHSEARHRRAISRAQQTMSASVELDKAAEEATRRAAAAADAGAQRYVPKTVARRLDRLNAEYRKTLREIDGYSRTVSGYVETYPPATGRRSERLSNQANQQAQKIKYWTEIQTEQQSQTAAPNFGPANVNAGDLVKIRGHWRRVARANTKSVAVETNYSWTDRVPWHEVSDHQTAKDSTS